MKSISAPLQTLLSAAPARYTLLYSLQLRDGSIYYRTEHQFDILGVSPFDGGAARYEASNAISISAIESTSGGVAQNCEVQIQYTEALTRDQVLAGLMDNATLIIDLVDWTSPVTGTVRVMTGVLQRKSVNDIKAGVWNMKGQVYLLDGFIGEVYSQECRNILGDVNCGVDLELFKETFTVSVVLGDYEYTRFSVNLSGSRPDKFFTLGTAKFGVAPTKYEILKDTGAGLAHTIILAVPRIVPIQVGDTGTLYAGCDKTHSSCLNKFNNILRMRAEPFNPVGALAVTQ